MKMKMLVHLLILTLALALPLALGQGTRIGFYAASCPLAESTVKSTVRAHFQSDPKIAPGLLRMHFHDCFVQGCDGSILINGTDTEKTGRPNLLLRGYEVIEDAKKQIEDKCPGVVSCADILALAARDSVVLTKGFSWAVPTGRKDGRVSLASETANLPGFRDSVDVQKKKFLDKNLNTQDLVALVGGHTIGTVACQFFQYRMYSFNATTTVDPSINPSFLSQLQSLCPSAGDPAARVPLDTGSGATFDNSFFSNLQNGRGILESDQMLWTDPDTKAVVQQFLGLRGFFGLKFNAEFSKSMVKMSNIEVKTGSAGEIRKVCSAIN